MTAVMHGSELELDRDRDLVELHQAGDRYAFTELYALHYGRLVRFCWRLTRDSHAAEEVAQEAFARAFASVHRLEGERRFYPWLTVIARRLVIDRVRERGRFEFHADLEAGFSRPAEDIAVQRIDGDHVAMAFGRLSDRHQDVLRLRDWEGLSYDAIAARLGVPSTTVAPLLHRARQSLRREYLAATRNRVASWLHLAPLFLAARRLRDRAAMWTAHLPDPSVFAAPMAGAVLGASMLLAPQITQMEDTASHSHAPVLGGLHIPDLTTTSGQAHSPQPDTGTAGPHVEKRRSMTDESVLRKAGVRPEGSVLGSVYQNDPATQEEHHRRMRRMPIYYRDERTGFFIAADPSAVGPFVDHVTGR